MLKQALALVACAALAAPALAGGYGYGYGGGYHYGGHYYGHGDDDDAGELLAGLVIGGLIGYFISEDRHYRRGSYPAPSYYHDPYYRDDYYDYGYYRRTYREYVPVRPAPRRIIVRETPEVAGHACRMTREYTTTVEIDGRQREAYGTRCLTADGSWVLGPAKLVPEFD